MARYLLDSNIFIQAHRVSYPFDVFPSFWNKLVELSDRGNIISIDKVKKELYDPANPDTLGIWCKDTIPGNFFVDSTSSIGAYMEIAQWAQSHPNYLQSAKDEFLATDLADSWLIAYAMENECVIVTYESSQPDIKRKIKIPEPCIAYGVRFIHPMDMFRELSQTF